MGVWLLMLGCNLLLPVIMLIAGKAFMTKPPQKINSWVGYRTEMSRKNADTWKFAHDCAGRFWWKWGWISLPIAVVPMLFLPGQPEDTIAIVGLVIACVLMIPLLAVIPHTEKALGKAFDKDGKGRED